MQRHDVFCAGLQDFDESSYGRRQIAFLAMNETDRPPPSQLVDGQDPQCRSQIGLLDESSRGPIDEIGAGDASQFQAWRTALNRNSGWWKAPVAKGFMQSVL